MSTLCLDLGTTAKWATWRLCVSMEHTVQQPQGFCGWGQAWGTVPHKPPSIYMSRERKAGALEIWNNEESKATRPLGFLAQEVLALLSE
jgi:hypothetical protein